MAEDALQGIVAIGEVLAGKYRVERVLGVGGMGVVVAAMHLELDERVALKFLLPEALRNAEAVGRFAREARAAVKIKSEHVARVIDVGKLDNGAPYMVMEFLSGGDLGELLEKRRQLRVHDAIEYVLQASEAVAEAHSLGIVHRDLKPANLYLARRADGSACVKVLDFGISKTTPGFGGSARDGGLTRTTAVMGSPLYMSPEQLAAARNADPRSDIWALGAILYELVTGQPPFMAEALPQLCTMILYSPPPPIMRPDMPPGLDSVILRCLEKDPGRRYANVSEFATALAPFGPPNSHISAERIARMLSISLPRPGPSAHPQAFPAPPNALSGSGSLAPVPLTTTSPGRTGGSWGSTTPPPRRGVALAIALSVGALTLAIGGGAVFMAMRKHPSPPTLAAPEITTTAPVATETAAPVVAPPPVETAALEPTPVASASASATAAVSPVTSASSAKPLVAPGKPGGHAVPGAAPGPRPRSLFGDRN